MDSGVSPGTNGGGSAPASIDAAGIALAGVSKHFGDSAVLCDVSLTVPPGTTCAILGPSGSGKTTLLRIIAGLERADSGSAHCDGRVLFDGREWVAPERRGIGMVFQDYAVFPHLSVGGNVAYGLPRGSHRRTTEVLDVVGLSGMEQRMPGTLSGGQLQRVALARALAPNPAVLLLDEPFSNLDVALRVRVRSEMHRLLADAGVTTVFVTHDQEEAFVLGDQVVVLRDGRVTQAADPYTLYHRPADAWTAGFVGDVNVLEGHADGSSAITEIGAVPLFTALGGQVSVVVRPEQIALRGPDQTTAANATIELVEFYGHDTMYEARHDSGVRLKARCRDLAWHCGDRVVLAHNGTPAAAFTA